MADYAAVDLEGKWVVRLFWSPRQREGKLTTRVSRAPMATADITASILVDELINILSKR